MAHKKIKLTWRKNMVTRITWAQKPHTPRIRWQSVVTAHLRWQVSPTPIADPPAPRIVGRRLPPGTRRCGSSFESVQSPWRCRALPQHHPAPRELEQLEVRVGSIDARVCPNHQPWYVGARVSHQLLQQRQLLHQHRQRRQLLEHAQHHRS